MLLGSQTTEFYMHEYLPFFPSVLYSTAWFWLPNRLLISQATPFADVRLVACLEEWKVVGRFFLQPSFNMSPRCVHAMGTHRALALFGDAKQAMGEGKSGLVETRLTGLVAMALWSNFIT